MATLLMWAIIKSLDMSQRSIRSQLSQPRKISCFRSHIRISPSRKNSKKSITHKIVKRWLDYSEKKSCLSSQRLVSETTKSMPSLCHTGSMWYEKLHEKHEDISHSAVITMVSLSQTRNMGFSASKIYSFLEKCQNLSSRSSDYLHSFLYKNLLTYVSLLIKCTYNT